MNTGSYRLILFAVIVAFGAAAFFAYHKNTERGEAVPGTNNLASYQNSTYDYSFLYPPEDTVRVASDEHIIVGEATTSSFVPYVEARIATSSDAASFGAFVATTVQKICVEEGKVCQTAPTSEPYHGGTRLTYGSEFGPVYAFDAGASSTARYVALVIYKAQGAPATALTPENIVEKLMTGMGR